MTSSKTLFLLCDVQEKFRMFNYFADFAKNINKVVSVVISFYQVFITRSKVAGAVCDNIKYFLQIQVGKILDVPLIVTEQNPEKLGATIKEFNIEHAIGTYGKTKFSMIIPEVVEKLKKMNDVETVVLFGLESHICVEQTAMDLLSLGKFDVHVVADCVLSRTLDDRQLALKRLENLGCFITSSENVIFKLLQDKNHPKFNDVRKLVAEPTVFPGALSNKL